MFFSGLRACARLTSATTKLGHFAPRTLHDLRGRAKFEEEEQYKVAFAFKRQYMLSLLFSLCFFNDIGLIPSDYYRPQFRDTHQSCVKNEDDEG